MSRSLIHLIVRYAVASAAVVMLLSIPSTARAGYPDGLNQYAGYHIMHDGVDPSGLWYEEDLPADGLNIIGRHKGKDKWLPKKGASLGKVKVRFRGENLCTGAGKVYLDFAVRMSDKVWSLEGGHMMNLNKISGMTVTSMMENYG